MKKQAKRLRKFESLTDFHRVFGQPKPLHPMISIIELNGIHIIPEEQFDFFMVNYYKIAYKENVHGKAKYGQNYYDFAEGGLILSSPNQLFEAPANNDQKKGYILLVHPDFLLSYPLAKTIKQYGFFSYAANEALHLSDHEKNTILSIFKSIDEELHSRIDDFSHDVMIAQLELLLNYCNRFYKRQFVTRKAINNDLLQKLDDILEQYFTAKTTLESGLPSVQYLADNLHVSPSYLSDMLRALTGQNAQQHIHNKVVEKAKEKLSTGEQTISEIAYHLGFEHSQSFSKFFKTKTAFSPTAFRESFN